MASTCRNRAARHTLVAVCLSVFLCGCGSGKSPVSPTPPEPPPVTNPPAPPLLPPGGVRVASVDIAARSAVVQWDPSEGAEHYVVEHGSALDLSLPRTTFRTDGPQTSMTLRDLPGDFLAVRVRTASGTRVSEPSLPLVHLQIVDFKDVTEALFFGTGPYGTGFFTAPEVSDWFVSMSAHQLPGRMLGWRAGRIPVRVEEDLTEPLFNNLVRVLVQVSELTGGEVRGEVVERTATLPDSFVFGELRVIARPDLEGPCSARVNGCAAQSIAANAEIVAGRIYITPQFLTADLMSHEVGHALLGLHHTRGVNWPIVPVMGGPEIGADKGFTTLEIDAIRAVYRAGLRFGATRADFHAQGLINRP
jgi:hypothetical protein